MLLRAFLASAVLLAAALPALAGDVLPGPYQAQVVRVIDGDTFEAQIHPWLDLHVRKRVRLCGIDTPERKEPGYEEAGDRLAELAGEQVILRNVQYDNFGRVLADVHAADGRSIAAILLREGLAQPYEGRRKCRRIAPLGDILP